MSQMVGLSGVERREAIRSIERAGDVIAASRWVAFTMAFLLSLPIFRLMLYMPMNNRFRALIGVIMLSLSFCCTFPFLGAAENIRMRREKTIRFWLIVSLLVIIFSLTASILFALFAFDQKDPTAHVIMAVLCVGCVVYATVVMIVLIRASKAVRELKLDAKPFGFDVVQPAPSENPEETNTPRVLPPRPNRNLKT